jgi:hypothetical protein
MSDIVFVDDDTVDVAARRRNISIIASIPARYALTRQIGANGTRREFSCRVVKISPDMMTVAAPVKGAVGERVIATLLEFGICKGAVLSTHELGFIMSIIMRNDERDKFAAKIEWYEKYKHHDLPDNRRAKRIIPQNPHSTIMLSDGSVFGAFVIDMSVSGAAISADIDPRIGEPLAVGRVVGRVVRSFAGGFAVKFVEPQNPQMLERLLLSA